MLRASQTARVCTGGVVRVGERHLLAVLRILSGFLLRLNACVLRLLCGAQYDSCRTSRRCSAGNPTSHSRLPVSPRQAYHHHARCFRATVIEIMGAYAIIPPPSSLDNASS
ncbi:hypothetical protein C2E23DRAFT_840078 [Lenzites betulinus]|nr:hypothetical protein C2E23DRAFT_840078 [Lenzites betulinus]